MKLHRALVKNFKLLEDVELVFSREQTRPLTVIRAENGSGKTSVLYALLWAFYGSAGLDQASAKRLSSTHRPPGEPCEISVRVEFDATEYEMYGGQARAITTSYLLTRTVIETPGEGDVVRRERDHLTVHSKSDVGADLLEDAAARALIRRMVPEEMKQIFFTDGDAVQHFIAGELGPKIRQGAVQNAIRALLGLDSLRMAQADLERARTTFRRRLAQASGEKVLTDLQSQIDQEKTERQRLQDAEEALRERLANITDAIAKRDVRLYELKDLGDVERIGRQRDSAKATLEASEAQLEAQKRRQRELMKSEALSWVLAGEVLEKGVDVLQELADRHVIPGTSVEVLRDRVELGVCICGESLAEGTARRQAVETLLKEQLEIDPARQRLTALLHGARLLHAQNRQRALVQDTWMDQLAEIEKLRFGMEKQIRDQEEIRKDCEESMRRLENADVAQLLEAQDRDRAKRDDFVSQRTENEIRLAACETKLGDLEERYKAAEAKVKVGRDLQDRADVTDDLLRLVDRTLDTLERDYLGRASSRMNELFMKIAGSTPEVPRAVFNEVRITPGYEIEVLSGGGYGRTLDPDFEINGASKRALTLSFIWALMEVADVSAPRIIDTPLGMTSGGVKVRFVELLTQPSDSEFQIVLLMTRSEIAGVEDLIDGRADIVQTLSASHQYPVDLVHDWGGDRPSVRVCTCDHRHSCQICARRDDHAYDLAYRA